MFPLLRKLLCEKAASIDCLFHSHFKIIIKTTGYPLRVQLYYNISFFLQGVFPPEIYPHSCPVW